VLAEAGDVRLTVHDVMGRRIAVLADGWVEAGWYARRWDGRDDVGHGVAPGIYFVSIEAEHFLRTRKMVLLK
jgi:hypothetical protein